MGKRFLAFLRTLPTVAQSLRININLEGWPGAIAVMSLGGAAVGIAAVFANATAHEEDTPELDELLDGEQQAGRDEPTEGSSDEADDPL